MRGLDGPDSCDSLRPNPLLQVRFMRIAVVGAGITGITTAHELATDGHEVTVLEQQEGVAAAASFAHCGLLAAALLEPVATPRQRRGLLGRSHTGTDRLETPHDWSSAARSWRKQWQSACATGSSARRQALVELGYRSQELHRALTRSHHLDHERSEGVLLVAGDAVTLEHRLQSLSEASTRGERIEQLDEAACRRIEPGLNPEARLAGGLWISEGGVGNCREFAHQLKLLDESRLGVKYHFGVSVRHLRRQGNAIQLQLRQRLESDMEAGSAAPRAVSFLPTRPMELPQELEFDSVVLATGVNAQALLTEAGLRLPLQPVWGRTATFRLREDRPEQPLRSALVDAGSGIRFTRLGQRLRVGGGHVHGTAPRGDAEKLYLPLYQALDQWLPLAARRGEVQLWQGARPTLPDGLPLIGPAPLQGVWLQLGHADHGWTLACGAARLLADQISGRASGIDPSPFASLLNRGWS